MHVPQHAMPAALVELAGGRAGWPAAVAGHAAEALTDVPHCLCTFETGRSRGRVSSKGRVDVCLTARSTCSTD